MNNPVKTVALLLAIALIVAVCLLAMYRREKESATTAKQETAELKIRLEGMEGELATVREQLNQLQDASSAARLINAQATPTDLSEVIRRVAQLEAQQADTLSFLKNSGNATVPGISPEKALAGQQQAITELSTRVAAQEEKVAAAKVKLKEWTSLNLPNDVIALDYSTALATPSLANYWPYFEAKRELEEAMDFARLLKRKVQLEELDLGIETARRSGISR